MANNKSTLYFSADDKVSIVVKRMQQNMAGLSNSMSKINSSNGGLGNMGKGISQISVGLGGATRGMQSLTGATGRLIGVAAGLAGVALSLNSIKEMFSHGLAVAANFDAAKNGMAGIITSVYGISDAQGKALEGSEKFTASLILAQDQANKLRNDVMNSAVSYSEALDTMQQGLGPGAAHGASIDEVRELAMSVTSAAKAMNMMQGMAGQELRALLTGKIDRTATIGTALQLQSDQVYKDALKSGKAADYLKDKLKGFVLAGKETAKTLSGTFATLNVQFDILSRNIVYQLTDQLQRLGPIIGKIFNPENGNVKEEYQPLIDMFDALGGSVGSGISDAVDYILEKAKDLGQYFKDNQQDLNGVSIIAGQIKDIFGMIWEIVIGLGLDLAKGIGNVSGLNTESEKTNEQMTTMGKTIKFIVGALELVKVAVVGIKIAFSQIIDVVRAMAAQLVDFVLDPIRGIMDVIATGLDAVGKGDWANSLRAKLESFKDTRINILASIQGDKNPYGIDKDKMDRNGGILEQALGGTINNNPITNSSYSKWARSTYNTNSPANSAVPPSGGDTPEESYLQKLDRVTKETIDKPLIAQLNKSAEVFANAGVKHIEGGLQDANSAYQKAFRDRLQREQDELEARVKKSGLTTSPIDGGASKDDGSAKRSFKTQLDTLKKNAQQQEDLYNDTNRRLDLTYSDGVTSIKNYFAERNKIYEDNYQTQKKSLEEQAKLVEGRASTAPDKEKVSLTKEALDIRNQLSKLETDHGYENLKNLSEQNKALREYDNNLLGIVAKIKELQGDTAGSRKISFDIEIQGLEKQYGADPEAMAKIKQYKSLTAIQNQFNDVSETYNRILDEQNSKEERINVLKENGFITELDSMHQIKDVRQSYIDQLTKQVEIAEKIQSQNPETLLAIEKMKTQLIGLKATVDPLKTKFDTLFNDSLAEAMTDFMDRTKTASEAFKDFAKGIERELLSLANKQIVKQLAETLFGSNGGENTFGSAISSLFANSKSTPSTSDSSDTGWVGSIGSFIGSFFGSGGAHAAGGSVGAGKGYKVGENGTEYFIPNQSGYLMNAPQTAEMMRRGGNSGNAITQIINITTPNANSFVQSSGQVSAQAYNALNKAKRNT